MAPANTYAVAITFFTAGPAMLMETEASFLSIQGPEDVHQIREIMSTVVQEGIDRREQATGKRWYAQWQVNGALTERGGFYGV